MFHRSFISPMPQTRDFVDRATIWTNTFCMKLTDVFLPKRLVLTEDPLRTDFVKK